MGTALNQQPGLETHLALTGTQKCRDPLRLAADINSLTEPWQCGHVACVAVGKGSTDIPTRKEFQRDQFNQKDCRGEALMLSRLRKYSYPDLQMEELAVWIYTEGPGDA